MDLTATILNIVFSKTLLYLSPIIFLIMAFTVADKLIGLIFFAFGNGRRNKYDS